MNHLGFDSIPYLSRRRRTIEGKEENNVSLYDRRIEFVLHQTRRNKRTA